MKTFVIGLAALAIGLFAGIAFMKCREQGACPFAWHSAPAAPPPGAPAFPPPANPNFAMPGLSQVDPFDEMRRMQDQVNQMMNQSIEQFRNLQNLGGVNNAPGYWLSLDTREFKDRFEVHAALPDAKDSDIHVKLTDDHTLNVEVSNKTSSNSSSPQSAASSEEWGNYTQTIQLPSPVQVNKMKVEHEDHELIIVLPKA